MENFYDMQIMRTQLEMANQMAKSNLLPSALKNRPGDILILLQQGKELNIPPMQAINGIHVIQGKPTISPQLMLALIYKSYPNALIDIKENHDEKKVTVKMAKDKNDTFHESIWDKERATKMQLINKDNWKKQFMTMCKWRAISEVCRTKFPHVIMGLYTTEEIDNDDNFNYDDDGNVLSEKEKKEAIEIKPTPQNEPKPDYYKKIFKEKFDKLTGGNPGKIKYLNNQLHPDWGGNRPKEYWQSGIDYLENKIDEDALNKAES